MQEEQEEEKQEGQPAYYQQNIQLINITNTNQKEAQSMFLQ
jgi:hypothetical protein